MQLSLLSWCSLTFVLSYALTPLYGCAVSANIAITEKSSLINACKANEALQPAADLFGLIEELYTLQTHLKELTEEKNYLNTRQSVEESHLESSLVCDFLLGMTHERYRTLQEKYADHTSHDSQSAAQRLSEDIRAKEERYLEVLKKMVREARKLTFETCVECVRFLDTRNGLEEFVHIFICSMTRSKQLRMGIEDRAKKITREYLWVLQI